MLYNGNVKFVCVVEIVGGAGFQSSSRPALQRVAVAGFSTARVFRLLRLKLAALVYGGASRTHEPSNRMEFAPR